MKNLVELRREMARSHLRVLPGTGAKGGARTATAIRLAPFREQIHSLLQEHPPPTIIELVDLLAAAEVTITRQALSSYLRKQFGWSARRGFQTEQELNKAGHRPIKGNKPPTAATSEHLHPASTGQKDKTLTDKEKVQRQNIENMINTFRDNDRGTQE